MKIKLTLAMAALCAFAALPAFAQHGGHGGGGGSGSGDGSMHSSSSASSHGNSADAKADKGSSNNGSSVSEKLTDNNKLASKLQDLLGPTVNLQTAAQGFKNLGQFVAAVHVSHNLGIPFDQLKTKMMGPPKESLGAAIHALKPDANSKEESKKAEQQAKQDLDDNDKAS